MKDAILWKRVLNEGLDARIMEATIGLDGHRLAKDIIGSTIIVERTQRFGYEESVDRRSSDYIGCAFAIPLEQFWMEFPEDRGTAHGSLFVASKANETGTRQASVFPVQGIRSRRPLMLPPVLLNFNAQQELQDWYSFHPSNSNDLTHIKIGGDLNRKPEDVSLRYVPMVLSALQLISCRNVRLDARDNEGKQVLRATKRFGKSATGYRYHVLVIRSPGASIHSESQEIGVMPWHLCRGHFQHYGPATEHLHPDGKDRGLLFGLHAGKFYVPPTWKGDKKNGEVAKDYAIAST